MLAQNCRRETVAIKMCFDINSEKKNNFENSVFFRNFSEQYQYSELFKTAFFRLTYPVSLIAFEIF